MRERERERKKDDLFGSKKKLEAAEVGKRDRSGSVSKQIRDRSKNGFQSTSTFCVCLHPLRNTGNRDRLAAQKSERERGRKKKVRKI